MTVSLPNAKLRTRPRWVFWLATIWAMVGLVATLCGPFIMVPPIWLAVLAMAVYFGGMFWMARVLMHWKSDLAGALRVDEHGLFLDGRQLASRKNMTHGQIAHVGERCYLRVFSRTGDGMSVDIEVTDETQANELLSTLHLTRTLAEYNLFARHVRADRSRLWSHFAGSLGFGFVSFFGSLFLIGRLHLPAVWIWLPFTLALAGVFHAILRVMARELAVSVGEDGLWVHQSLVSKRFISFRDLRGIERSGLDLTITRTDGTTMELHCATFSEGAADDLVARVRAGIAASQAAPQRTGEAVGRNGRSIAEWIANAKKAHERTANYRQPVVPQAELWRIVEDVAAEPTERAGAALALRADLDDDGKTRLRVAAGACASPKLRVALESVVGSDDDALREALEPLQDEPRATMALR